MRFCHVSTFYPPYHFGGDAILAQSICEGLARRGHDVTVVHAAEAYELLGDRVATAPVDPPGITRHALRSRLATLSPILIQQTGRPGLLGRQLREILAADFDVVHFHNVSLVGGPGVLPLSRAPVTLHTTHDHWLVCTTHVLWKNTTKPCDRPQCVRCALRSGTPPQLWRLGGFVNRCLEHVDAILAPSQFTADRHRAAGITRPIRVLPSFTHLAPPDESTATEAPRPATGPFVFAGRLVRSKGIEQLLDAVAQRPSIELQVVGEGPLGPALRAQYQGAAHIRFVGAVPHHEMQALYRRATAVVIPSWGPEVFPLAVLEAMACGAPVLVRRAGGSAEAVERTGGGLVYDAPEELLPLLDRLVADAGLRATLSSAARRGTAAAYLEDSWMTAYFACIDEIMRAKGVAR